MSIPASPSLRVPSATEAGRPAPSVRPGGGATPITALPPDGTDALPPCWARYRAAWIPACDAARPWDPTPEAVRWLLEQAEQLRLKPVLLRGRTVAGRLPPALRYLERRAARELRRPAPGRAVLAYLPDVSTAARAFRDAEGGAVVVVEAPDLPLVAWAAEARALNLLSGRTEAALAPATVDGLRPLLGAVEGGRFSPVQDEAACAGSEETISGLSADAVAGYLLAHGCGARIVRRLVGTARG